MKEIKEIKEMYENVMDKKAFRYSLAEKLFLTEGTVTNNLKTNGKFKKEHIEKVKQCLTIQLQIDEQTRDINVKAWSLI